MSTVLGNINKDNTRFTIFENDQVLTADQLNDLFNYLDVQTRLTRTRAIGVGIICGLKIGALENKNMVVSKGAAITTDGDMLHIDDDREFDQYEAFEDVNAKYPYFRTVNDLMIPVFELSNSRTPGVIPANPLSVFEETTLTSFKDYVGILYLEDYKNDPDICTGTDCDNKGAEAAKELKVLLVHINNMRQLLQSMPAINKNYFSLNGISIPRVNISTAIDTYPELNESFKKALIVKEEIKNKLTDAYRVCKSMLEDEFNGTDPTKEWSALIDQHFNVNTTLQSQYVYDFCRDISFAYNEMHETLFADNMLCCPDADLFPKHVLMGLVKQATIGSVIDSPISSPIMPPLLDIPFFSSRNLGISVLRPIRFDIGLFIRRFHPIHIDTTYRHQFYESPVLNNKEGNILQTRFCFNRINALIRNFKIPTVQEMGDVNQSVKITPSHYEDKPLGERSIPFYYQYNPQLPVNLYWNYQANIRQKEDELLYYAAFRYPNSKSSTVDPLNFSILPYDFFRIEGHIGFDQVKAETAINNLILQHNLPFNVLCVQVERIIFTIPRRPWHFPEIFLQDVITKRRFFDNLNQAEAVNNKLKVKTAADPEAPEINLTMENFANAKAKVMDYQSMSQPDFNVERFKTDVQSMVSATAEVKVRTNKYDFAQTAVPHDFLINTDIINKADLIADLIKQRETKKLEDLMLGNFMKQNSGVEHAGGVLRGGTFVLVYTSNDKIVVADFMLPYYVADKDVVSNPPVPKPLPIPLPELVFDKIFDKTPIYKTEINTLVLANTLKFGEFDRKLQNSEKLFDQVVKYTPQTRLDLPNVNVIPGKDDLVLGNIDFKEPVLNYRKSLEELEGLAEGDTTRPDKEAAVLKAAEKLTNELSQPAVAADVDRAIVIKSVLADIHSGISQVKDVGLSSKVTELNNATNAINKGLIRNR